MASKIKYGLIELYYGLHNQTRTSSQLELDIPKKEKKKLFARKILPTRRKHSILRWSNWSSDNPKIQI